MKSLFAAIALAGLVPVGAASPLCGTAYAQACCKVCTKGKACGDTCIARDKNCTKGPGCACDG